MGTLMKRLLLPMVALFTMGSGAPSVDPFVSAYDPQRSMPMITAVTCTPSIATLTEANEPLTIVCDVTHNGYLGYARLAIKCGDLAAGEYNHDLSDYTKGERISRTVMRYTTNMCERDHWSTPGLKTVTVDVYPGDAVTATECESQGAQTDLPQCSDGDDNDSDGDTDFPADVNCGNPLDTSEATPQGCGLGFELIFLAPLLRALARRRR